MSTISRRLEQTADRFRARYDEYPTFIVLKPTEQFRLSYEVGHGQGPGVLIRLLVKVADPMSLAPQDAMEVYQC